jgi:peptidase M48-like protein
MCRIRFWLIALAMLAATVEIPAQYPQGAQVISYFPHLAVGGPVGALWTTNLTFVNPNLTGVAAAIAYFVDDNGGPLSIDFGTGAASSYRFNVPPQGSVTLRSVSTLPVTVEGSAVVDSSLPLQGVLQYILTVNGVQQQSISVQSTPRSHLFRSPANRNTGLAIVNPNSAPISVLIAAGDGNGNGVGQGQMSITPGGHRAFNLFQVITNLPSTFQGSVQLTTPVAAQDFLALTISADGNALSAYPPAGLNWPASQPEIIYKVWSEVLYTANRIVPLNPAPSLVIDPTTSTINAFANPAANQVSIYLNLAELISDSESELAFVLGHELGHILQSKIGLIFVPTNRELDADQHGMLLALLSGYDPYGAAGALAKLAMASGTAGLVDQNFDNLASIVGGDLHGSFNNRLALVFENMQLICSAPQNSATCSNYKSLIHPHLPPIAPLSADRPIYGTPSHRSTASSAAER